MILNEFQKKNFRINSIISPRLCVSAFKKFLFGSQTVLLILYLAVFASFLHAEKLPLKHFTMADGLPQNSINVISQDKQGFFWIGTKGGLSRFDGYDFVNFTQQENLPKNEVLDFLESREGEFWLATTGGLVKFNPDGKIYDHVVMSEEAAQLKEPPLFITYALPALKVTKLLEDSRGTIWIGTSNGLFQLHIGQGQERFSPVEINLAAGESKYVFSIYEDRQGAVWIGTENALTRIVPDKHLTSYHTADSTIFRTVLEDHAGNFWVGTYSKGLLQFAVDESGNLKVIKQFAAQPNSEVQSIDRIIESRDGKLLLGGTTGLYEFSPAENKLLHYTRTSGIGYYRFQTMLEDRNGNLWLGTLTNGLYRLSTEGLVAFGTEDRISFIRSVSLDNENHLILAGFVTNTELDEKGAKVSRDFSDKVIQAFDWRFGRLDENGFAWLIPKFPKSVETYSWGEGQTSFQAKNGEWWIATGNGLFSFPKVKFEELKDTLPINVFSEKSDKMPSVFHIFEDSRENIWISTEENGSAGLYKWERATEMLHDISQETNFSSIKFNLINSFAEDGAGNIWVGFRDRGYARLRNGKFDFYGDNQKSAIGGVASVFLDREKRLWIASRQNGILRIDHPEDENPSIINYTKDDGLSTNRTLSLTEDWQGFIYIGTDSNINRFDPQTHEFKYLSLPSDQPQREYRSAICDKNGTLWFGTTEGLTKYVPILDKPINPPEILITNVVVGVVPQKVSAVGTKELSLPTLSPEQNQVRINFVSLSNLENESDDISYQYKINENGEWSKPGKERFVNFANLSSGNYQIYFRAIIASEAPDEQALSVSPAFVKFRILPPIYLRWWFITLLGLLAIGIIYAFYRARLGKLLELERTRTLIATDLHDDIGSNLSKISVLSEVVRMQLENEGKENNKLLGSIAEISRESVSSMSDIVWAINPKRDSVLEMTRKMREYTEEMFVPKGVGVKFSAEPKNARAKLPMDLRRELYLIFKEIVNNAAKHSNCDSIQIDFQIGNKEILLTIEDSGSGFDCTQETNGNGLSNIKNRVEKLKGKLQIKSEKDYGTTIRVNIPHS